MTNFMRIFLLFVLFLFTVKTNYAQIERNPVVEFCTGTW